MSDHEDEFQDTIEGPTDDSKGGDFDYDAELKKFDDMHDENEKDVLRRAQEQEEQALKEEDIVDDGHDRSIEEALKAKAEGNE